MSTDNFDKYKEDIVWSYSTRHGGVSSGKYASMNLSFSTGDGPEKVRENYRLWGEALGVDTSQMVLLKQTHTANVLAVDHSFCGEGLYRPARSDFDGMVTDEKGVALVTSHADCTPVYIYDPVSHAIAMVHAGWKGTVGEIPAHAIELMKKKYGSRPEDMIAMIGPCISQKRFQCDRDVVDRVDQMSIDGSDQYYFDEAEGKFHVSLAGLNRKVLVSAGIPVENIDMNDACTYDNDELYFSHRRMGKERGGQAALLMMK